MISSFREIERVFVCEQNPLATAPTTFPATMPFPIPLINGSLTELCTLTIPIHRRRDDNSFFISAFINWEMTGAASTLSQSLGTAQVAFELTRDNIVIFRAIETLVRPPDVAAAVTVFGTVNLMHLNSASACNCSCPNKFSTFTVRANNILLTPAASVSAAVGAVTLKIEELRCS